MLKPINPNGEEAGAPLWEPAYSTEYLERDLTEAELAAPLAACDCLVHPSRACRFMVLILLFVLVSRFSASFSSNHRIPLRTVFHYSALGR